jgi:hypothetical protein
VLGGATDAAATIYRELAQRELMRLLTASRFTTAPAVTGRRRFRDVGDSWHPPSPDVCLRSPALPLVSLTASHSAISAQLGPVLDRERRT